MQAAGHISREDSRRPIRERRAEPLLLFVAFVACALILQVAAGTFRADLAGYPDEPSHLIGGLLVRDYIAEGFPAPPLQYARDYYSRYPKVAIGHWPPVFYVVEGIWLLVLGPAKEAAILLLTVISAGTAWLVARAIEPLLGGLAALLSGLLFLALPPVSAASSLVMPEVLLAAFGLLAALEFVRYLEAPDWRSSARFGVFASLCILTKGNGWAITLLPALAMLIGRRLPLMGRLDFWVGPVVVAVLCLPWHILTRSMIRHVWTADNPFYWINNAAGAIEVLMSAAGIPFFVVAVVGAAVTLSRRYGGGTYFWQVMASLLLATLVFNVAIPLDVEARKLIMAMPPLVLFSLAGTVWLTRRLVTWKPQLRAATLALTVLVFAAGTPAIARKERRGFAEAAQSAVAMQPSAGSTYLVSGSASGEGAFIAEIALMRYKQGDRTVVRANKALAASDWNGKRYRLLVRTTRDLQRLLDLRAVSVVVLEHLSEEAKTPHHRLLEQTLAENSRTWALVPAPDAGAHVFCRKPPVKSFAVAGASLRHGL